MFSQRKQRCCFCFQCMTAFRGHNYFSQTRMTNFFIYNIYMCLDIYNSTYKYYISVDDRKYYVCTLRKHDLTLTMK